MDIPSSPPSEFDVGRIVRATFGAMGRNAPVLLVLALALTIIPSTIEDFAEHRFALPGGQGLVGPRLTFALLSVGFSAISMAGALMLGAACVHVTAADVAGRRAAPAEALAVGFRFCLPLFGFLVLYLPAVIAGYLLLIAPGVMMSVAWIVALPALVLERTGVLRSFSRSAELTRGRRWRVLGLMVAYVVAAFVFDELLLRVCGVRGFRALKEWTWPRLLVVGPILHLLSVVNAVGTTQVYFELRRLKQGAIPETLAAVFD